MIELITGAPGAGKTTFAVAMRLAAEAKRKITLDPETCVKLGVDVGTEVTRRIVVAGIRGLKIEHERLPHILTRDATGAAEVARWNAMQVEHDEATGRSMEGEGPVHQRLPGDPALDVPAIMQNWWLWCKPGDLIVIDEAQFVMPRGTLGRKPPYWLQAFEVHRHYGVDFLLITQHPQLIDTTIRALVGLHRHVRPVMGSALCMVYVWDYASNPERYHMANKEKFIRRAEHYRLFHSAAAHVKPPTSGRWSLVFIPLMLVVGLGGLAWKVSAFGGGGVEPSPAAAGVERSGGAVSVASAASRPTGARRPGFLDVPKLAGCYAHGDQCGCIDGAGRPVRVAQEMCVRSSRGYDGLVEWEPRAPLPLPSGGAASAPVARSLFGAAAGGEVGEGVPGG